MNIEFKLEKPADIPDDMWNTAEAVAQFISQNSPNWIKDKKTLLAAVMNKLVFGGLAYRLDSNRHIVSTVLYGCINLSGKTIDEKDINNVFWNKIDEEGDTIIVDKLDGYGVDASSILTDVIDSHKNASHVVFIDRKDKATVLTIPEAKKRITLLRVFSNQRFKLN